MPTKDELLVGIMIYWVSQSINSSIRGYAEKARVIYMGGLKSSQLVEGADGEYRCFLKRLIFLEFRSENE